ncbi:hypothetical protein PMIN06_013026 [Paraphaeosphaeria minitans]
MVLGKCCRSFEPKVFYQQMAWCSPRTTRLLLKTATSTKNSFLVRLKMRMRGICTPNSGRIKKFLSRYIYPFVCLVSLSAS